MLLRNVTTNQSDDTRQDLPTVYTILIPSKTQGVLHFIKRVLFRAKAVVNKPLSKNL